MFEYKKDEKRYAAMHHPFTMPFPEDVELMQEDRTKPLVRSQAYDVVLNGVELGSGSVRIHRADIQQKVFRALGFDKEESAGTLRVFAGRVPLRHAAACGVCLRRGPAVHAAVGRVFAA